MRDRRKGRKRMIGREARGVCLKVYTIQYYASSFPFPSSPVFPQAYSLTAIILVVIMMIMSLILTRETPIVYPRGLCVCVCVSGVMRGV